MIYQITVPYYPIPKKFKHCVTCMFPENLDSFSPLTDKNIPIENFRHFLENYDFPKHSVLYWFKSQNIVFHFLFRS
jgi:hypothetical protein